MLIFAIIHADKMGVNMKRDILLQIKEWDSSGSRRKPLIMMGARQVGKTWLMKAFAEERYPNDTVLWICMMMSRCEMRLKTAILMRLGYLN